MRNLCVEGGVLSGSAWAHPTSARLVIFGNLLSTEDRAHLARLFYFQSCASCHLGECLFEGGGDGAVDEEVGGEVEHDEEVGHRLEAHHPQGRAKKS